MSYIVEIYKEEQIIKYTVSGRIEKKDIGVGWSHVFNMKEFTELNYMILADYCNAEFRFSINDTQILDEILGASNPSSVGKKIAVVVNIPRSTAISMLIKEKFLKDKRYNVKIFYTTDAAMKWLIE